MSYKAARCKRARPRGGGTLQVASVMPLIIDKIEVDLDFNHSFCYPQVSSLRFWTFKPTNPKLGCNVPSPRGRACLHLAAFKDIDCPHRPTPVFSARLTSEFFGDRLP